MLCLGRPERLLGDLVVVIPFSISLFSLHPQFLQLLRRLFLLLLHRAAAPPLRMPAAASPPLFSLCRDMRSCPHDPTPAYGSSRDLELLLLLLELRQTQGPHASRGSPQFPSTEKLIVDADADEVVRNKTILPTARGLLLVRDPDTMATFLWNPSDGSQVHLPPLEGLQDATLMHSHCVLSDEPSAAGCVVLLVEGGDDTFIWYCRPGDDGEGWVKHEYDIGTQILDVEEDLYEKSVICPVAACRGKFYFNPGDTDLGVLEFCPDPVITFIAIDDDWNDDDGFQEEEEDEDDDEDEEEEGHETSNHGEAVFLVESGGELYRVSLVYATARTNEVDDVLVDRWNFSELRWRGVDDLGGRTFFLSLFYFGASCSVAEHGGLQQDCVYVVYPRRKEMLIVDVKEGTNCLRKLGDEAPAADKAFWLLPATP
ncbi:hypothetical protein HU200_011289 [Digitaria exilis]|uniref:KIB1-4 beta-propeller domain-containing protein n=1 Tax=Digitaria exilis TaxID=1010633 RepID=A0A835FH20_9POAL|nr:hypothetical protein HU200_011289 [Digitaria exilis]